MMHAIEAARLRIEQALLERNAAVDQIDVVQCEAPSDLMAYVYIQGSDDCIPILIECGDEVEYFDLSWLEQALWPRAPSRTVH